MWELDAAADGAIGGIQVVDVVALVDGVRGVHEPVGGDVARGWEVADRHLEGLLVAGHQRAGEGFAVQQLAPLTRIASKECEAHIADALCPHVAERDGHAAVGTVGRRGAE